MEESTLEAAHAVASHFVGYAARSRAEVERRLERAGFEADVIVKVIADFESRGWLDDAELARAWIADRADRKQYGKARLQAELRRKGIGEEVASEALSTVEEQAELERARAAARGKWRSLPEDADPALRLAERRRLAAFLQRRGFAWPIITQVLSDLMANT